MPEPRKIKGESMICGGRFAQLEKIKRQRISRRPLLCLPPGTAGLLQGEQSKEMVWRKRALFARIELHGQENGGAIVCRQGAGFDQMSRDAAKQPG
jgi:hypothetical protein